MLTYIYYTGSPHLKVLLTQLQPQLSENDDIYIVDVTKDRSGVKIAKLYGSSRCYIFVEVGNHTRENGIKFALQSMEENKHDTLLVINENSLISATFVANLKRLKTSHSDFSLVSPIVIKTAYPQLPSNFSWYNPSTSDVKETSEYSRNCYLFNPKGKKAGRLLTETVILISDGL